eukprot:Anaeramoba_flamelloidesa2130_45.p1 GENE.a2130_45~~a2130_45.p1  ORF type:complete len:506 (+),score=86.84 a2130_45:62-1579(+)
MSRFEKKLKKRKQKFKNTTTREDRHSTRVNYTINLSKKRREEVLKKKRNLNSFSDQTILELTDEQIEEEVQNIPNYINKMINGNIDEQYTSTQRIRVLLSIEKDPPINEILEHNGILTTLVKFLDYDNHQRLQFEAAWSLTNIAAGLTEHTRMVINAGSLPAFSRLIISKNESIQEQSIWAIGNIAGDCAEFRDKVIENGVVPKFIDIIKSNPRIEILKSTTWALCNICRAKPHPELKDTNALISVFISLLDYQDIKVVSDSCWSLCYLADGEPDIIEYVVKQDICPKMVNFLKNSSPIINTPALRFLGNIVTGTDDQTQEVLNCGVLPILFDLLIQGNPLNRKEVCWTLSNICAGSPEQIQAVIDQKFVPLVIEILKKDTYAVRKEAAWTISNLVYMGNVKQMIYLINNGAIDIFCDLLSLNDVKILNSCLESLTKILKLGDFFAKMSENQVNRCAQKIDEVGGIKKIDLLYKHQNVLLSKTSKYILDKYFPNYVTENYSEEED